MKIQDKFYFTLNLVFLRKEVKIIIETLNWIRILQKILENIRREETTKYKLYSKSLDRKAYIKSLAKCIFIM